RYGNRVLVVGAGTMAAGYLVLVVTLWPGPASSGPVTALVVAPALLVAGAGQGMVAARRVGVGVARVPEGGGGGGAGGGAGGGRRGGGGGGGGGGSCRRRCSGWGWPGCRRGGRGRGRGWC